MCFLKTYIYHEWDNLTNLFVYFTNHNTLGVCGESGIKIDLQIPKWEPFPTNSQKQIYTQVKSMGLYLCIDLCTMLLQCTNIWLLIVLCALLTSMIPWYNTTSIDFMCVQNGFDYLSKKRKKDSHFIITTSILKLLSSHPPKI